MLKQSLSLITTAGLLAGCGAATETVAIVTKTIGNDVIVIGESPTQSSLNEETLDTAAFQPDHDAGVLKAWNTPYSAFKGYFAESSSGGSVVFVAGTNGTTKDVATAAIARTTPTALPTSGTVNYTGDYAGVYQIDYTGPDELDFIVGLITGDANINANFKDNEVTGTITNRVVRSSVSNEVTPDFNPVDVSLSLSPIYSDGSFSGITSGGQLVNTSPSPIGEYQGLISGDEGQEAIGAIRILHRSTPDTSETIEVGVFMAD